MQKYIKEARIVLSLAIPVIFAQIAQTAMGIVDTIMSGSVSAVDMAAVAIGTSMWLPVILFGHGLLLSLTPIISQFNGSGKRGCIPYQVCQGLWLAFGISCFIILLLYYCNQFINYILYLETPLNEKTKSFLFYLQWGAPGYLFFQVFRCQCEGLSYTKPGMVVSFIGLLSNIPINYIFIYGKLGMPVMGGSGCGIATALVYWIMFLLLYGYVNYSNIFHDLRLFKYFKRPNFLILKRLFLLGLPIALALFFEVTLFALVTLLVAPLGIVAVAGHQIALNFSSLMFVFPLSVGVAATIRIGFCLGEKNVEQAKISSWTSLIIGIILACCTAILTSLFRKQIALLYNDTPSVVSIASNLMLLASIYQISDSIQVIGNSVLRGYKDTRSIFYITFIAYWLLGLPCGYILALTDIFFPAMGPSGFWVGFIIGLTSSAILMIFRMYILQKQTSDYILEKSEN
ncbi:Multidrug resistance protein mdtK [Candidatus Westeberhardia cardiocondylae]|uniref:Multidrug-efflux transporter n=1 Tax=Candidatus Westeberhardia cardiocondylae TaxID=1594731 RepID=A0A0H5BX71_9ENTR|nr:MATE family efflux transporter [Candidatus Westeberhardia cardiocondylae]CEN32219.1 Multidrug resistance protein mdtK [Candidatus Westeberhardia cardiocondylae]